MNVLILNPGRNHLNYCLSKSAKGIVLDGVIENYRGPGEGLVTLSQIEKRIKIGGWISDRNNPLDAVAIRVIHGGDLFDGPVQFSDEVRIRLSKLIPLSPLNIPAIITIAESCVELFPEVPVILLFETAFFKDLPERERNYAINPDLATGYKIQKSGYHGLLHESASRFAGKLSRSVGIGRPARVMSICLDSRSEASAIYGGKPLTVTGGVTPLEGLIGDNSCGDMDPGILVKIAGHYQWGPEKINQILTEESGLSGLVGRKTTLPEVFYSDLPEYKKAREVFFYKLLQVCGAGMAAVGPFDFIIFSGRYQSIGNIIGPMLMEKLNGMLCGDAVHKTRYLILSKSLEQVIAEKTATMVKELRSCRTSKLPSPYLPNIDSVISGS